MNGRDTAESGPAANRGAAGPVFTAEEREVIRTAFITRFGSAPSLAEGFSLARWAGGPRKGEVKLSKAQQRMLEHGLIQIVDDGAPWPRALLTEAGLAALRAMAADPRALNPDAYGSLIRELRAIPGAVAESRNCPGRDQDTNTEGAHGSG